MSNDAPIREAADSPQWQSSLRLNEAFYRRAIARLVAPWPHAAALLGWGSDILGYDTEQSSDHGWGPRLQVFVDDRDVAAVREAVDAGLPESFQGWPVRYGWDAVPVQHHVQVTPLRQWLLDNLGLDPRDGLSPLDWLLVPQQRLLGVTRGAVYHDGIGALSEARDLVAWYPRDVWLWLLASQWDRVSQEEAFGGRAAQVGDDIGSRVVAARQVRELMRLCLLLARRYSPYTKWLGSAFGELPDPDGLGVVLRAALDEARYDDRERALARAYELVAGRHNASGLTARADPATRTYYGRPFAVLMAGRFVEATMAAIADETLRALPPIGSVDQFIDSTPVLQSPDLVARLRVLYERRA